MSVYLSRLTLRRDPSIDALAALLDPHARSRALDAHHRLIWSAFAGDPDQRRDFLWRSEGKGVFYVLSKREPARSPFFAAPEVKPFAPKLAIGDRLEFVLRVNATRTRETGRTAASGRPHKAHDDIVMHAIRGLPADGEARRVGRMEAAQRAGAAWLAGQGARAGFALLGEDVPVRVQDYSVMALPGHLGKRAGQPQFGIMEMTGHIEVTGPDLFSAKLREGFGRAKAFGCGLMMIRRA